MKPVNEFLITFGLVMVVACAGVMGFLLTLSARAEIDAYQKQFHEEVVAYHRSTVNRCDKSDLNVEGGK